MAVKVALCYGIHETSTLTGNAWEGMKFGAIFAGCSAQRNASLGESRALMMNVGLG